MLWCFGDSYIEQHLVTDKYWVPMLARRLSMLVSNHAKGGTALGYTYYQFHQQQSNFKYGDIVIIGLTSINRNYFFVDRPNISFYHKLFANDVSPEELTAMKLYTQYLFNESEIQVNIKNFLYSVQHICNQLALKVIIIPLFDDYNFIDVSLFPSLDWAVGQSLSQVSNLEFIDDNMRHALFQKYNMSDIRLNHLCYQNHVVLSDKLYKCITESSTINLSTEFEKKFLTSTNYQKYITDQQVLDRDNC